MAYYDPSGYSLISSESFSDLVVKANREGIGGLSDSQVSDMAEYWRKNNPNPYKLSQEQAENVMRQGYKYPMEERVGKGLEVPKPESYLPREYIENHTKSFADGAAHLENGRSYDAHYSNANYFQRWNTAEHHIFVAPKNEMVEIVDSANGDKGVLAKALGYQENAFHKENKINIIYINDVKRHNLHIPIGNEMGCNDLWGPGGYTSGMTPESIAHNVKNPAVCPGDYLSDDIVVECKELL